MAATERKPTTLAAAFGAGLRRGLRVRGALTFLVRSSTVRRHVLLCTIANLGLLGVGLSRMPVVKLLDWFSRTRTPTRTTVTGLARALLASLAKGGHLGGSVLAYVVVMALTNGWTSAIARSVAAEVAARRRAAVASAATAAAAAAAAGSTAAPPLPPAAPPPPPLPPRGGSVWAGAADALLRVVVVALMTAGTVVLDAGVPVVGRPAALLLCAFLYSLTAHDAVEAQLLPAAGGTAAAAGAAAAAATQPPLEARLLAAEASWPYHVGFGLPAAALSFVGNWVVNGATYGLALPWLVLLAGAAAAAAAPSPPPRRVRWRLPLTWPFRAATLLIARAAAGGVAAWRWYRRRSAAASAAAGGASSDSDGEGR
jgi:hypothetical protein